MLPLLVMTLVSSLAVVLQLDRLDEKATWNLPRGMFIFVTPKQSALETVSEKTIYWSNMIIDRHVHVSLGVIVLCPRISPQGAISIERSRVP